MLNNKGAKTLPWGTPLVIWTFLTNLLLIKNSPVLSLTKNFTKLIIPGATPISIRSFISILGITKSKAPSMSINSAPKLWSCAREVAMLVDKIATLSWQERVFLNPNWLLGRS